MRPRHYLLFTLLFVSNLNAAGILVYRSDRGFQFAEADSILVNGKDRVLNLGAQPKVAGQAGKLPAVKLGGPLVRDSESSTVVLYDAARLQYVVPQPVQKNGPSDPAAMWRDAKMSYRKSAADKAGSEIPPEQFVAFLPSGVDGLAALVVDQQALRLIGGKGGFFPAQILLLSAAVKAYGSQPAMAGVEKHVEDAMRQCYERFEGGLAGTEALEQGLELAKLSGEAYPAQPEQQRLRTALAQRKAWLDKRRAILRALFAGSQWDAFLIGYHDFAKYQASFPDMLEKHSQALQRSLDLHWKTGRERMVSNEYRAAFRELSLASLRNPVDSALQKELSVAWTEYSRQAAVDRVRDRKQLSAGQSQAIAQALHFASRYKEQNKLDDALKSVVEAESIDPDSLPLLLKKAELLGARRELANALATLDRYDQRAVDDERAAGYKLRNELLFQLTTTLKDLKSQVEKAWAGQSYSSTRKLALDGLRVKEDDPDLLYYAGVSSLVTRNPGDAMAFLKRYVEISDTVGTNREQRATAYRLLASSTGDVPPEQGASNWFSGKKLPKGVFYCPISLAFQGRVERIAASNKLSVEYEWEGDRLKSITPHFEKNAQSTGEKTVYFAYESRVPQVRFVGYEASLPKAPDMDADQAVRAPAVVLVNNPLVDPAMVEKLTGARRHSGSRRESVLPAFRVGEDLFLSLHLRRGRAREVGAADSRCQ